jgi:hypothetical protein
MDLVRTCAVDTDCVLDLVDYPDSPAPGRYWVDDDGCLHLDVSKEFAAEVVSLLRTVHDLEV